MARMELYKGRGVDPDLEEKIKLEKAKKNEGISGIDLTSAIEILGKEDVFGPDAVQSTFGVELKEVPPIPYSKEELEKAKEFGQVLILRVDKTSNGEPMSINTMKEATQNRFVIQGNHGSKDGLSKASPRLGWALVSKEVVPESEKMTVLEQMQSSVKILEEMFPRSEMPAEYAQAIMEFVSKTEKNDFDSYANKLKRGENVYDTTQFLDWLKINKLTRQTIEEAVYDLMLYSNRFPEASLRQTSTLTGSRYFQEPTNTYSDGFATLSYVDDSTRSLDAHYIHEMKSNEKGVPFRFCLQKSNS